LTEWEVNAKQRIVDHFDLVAGTSTGGIIALGLGLGIPATDILKFYRSKDLSERRMGSEKALKLAAFLPSKVRASDASHGPAAGFPGEETRPCKDPAAYHHV
jgi:hypothetical protein